MDLNHLPHDAREWFEEGFEHHQTGDLEQAIECYERSLDVAPSAEAHTFLGWAFSHKGDLDTAIEECFKAIQVDPDFGNPYNDIGAYYIQLGRYDEAIPWLERAMKAERYESYHYPHLNLGRVYLKKGMYIEAVGALEKALEIEPQYQPALLELAKIRAMMN
ncbi:MAG: tetratricopeptide repeat protein [Candidatus Tectimicrobiota bacterium]